MAQLSCICVARHYAHHLQYVHMAPTSSAHGVNASAADDFFGLSRFSDAFDPSVLRSTVWRGGLGRARLLDRAPPQGRGITASSQTLPGAR
eukprot:3939642-Prymnesium_polylepis.2